MTRVRNLQSGLILLAAGSLAAGLSLAGFWWGGVILAVVGLVWVYAGSRGWDWAEYPGFAGITLAAGAGFLLGLQPLILLLAAGAALSAWDLGRFRRRLELAGFGADTPALLKRHLVILLVVNLTGLGLAGLALVVRLGFNLWIAILLTFALVFVFSRAARYLRRVSE